MALNTLPAGAFADDAITSDKINLANTFAFTGTVTGTPQGMTFLQGQDASSSSAVTVGSSSLFSSTYKVYMIQGININLSGDGNNLHVRYTLSSGTKSDTYYPYVRIRMYSGSASVSGYNSSGDAQIPYLGESMGTSGGENGYFTMFVYNPADTTKYKTTQFIAGTQDTSTEQQMNITSGSYDNSTEALHGIYIFPNTGTIASGRFNLYGIANA
jgi:hypothetical protein